MTRSVPTAALAALAVLAAALPLRTLFDGPGWFHHVVLAVAVVVVTGVLLRRLTRSALVLLLGQVLALGLTLALDFARDTLVLLLPTPETARAAVALMEQSRETITGSAAPAPMNDGVAFSLALVIGMVAITADLAAATGDAPVAAGIPIGAVFAVSAANSTDPLHWAFFVLPAALWMTMVVAHSRAGVMRWVTMLAGRSGEDHEERVRRDHTRQGVGLAAMALALALFVPGVIPHLSPYAFGEGLRSGSEGPAPGRGEISLSSEIDLRRSLEDPDPAPVIRYETDDPTPPPLRVGVAEDFVDGRASIPQEATSSVPPGDLAALGVEASQEESWTTRFVENLVLAPQLPSPFATVAVRGDVESWTLDQNGVARAQSAGRTYEVDYIEPLDDTEAVLGLISDGGPSPTTGEVDPRIADELRAVLDTIVDPGSSDLEAAQAIQSYLRGDEFSYDLDLQPGLPGEHPVSRFLRTKQGYCQQFAATMAHLAQAHGIPARFVVGFLPGTSDVDGGRVVRAADAHAWPELYFPGVGWLRFEPTPGGRAANVPGYSIQRAEVESSSTSTTSFTSSPSTEESDPDAAAQTSDERTGVAWARPLLVALGIAVLLGVLPLTALVLRERSRRREVDPAERVEREWTRLLTELADLGVEAPVGATPRQSGRHLMGPPGVSSANAERMGAIVGAVERARYAPPGAPVADIGHDVDRVVQRVRRGRSRSARVQAALAPTSARAWWRELPGRGTSALARRAATARSAAGGRRRTRSR